ncbi:hypothetical protein B0T25DRAFT_359738 [Lasiosphaeria hispida]|uniref:Uncharacterized protein n=1 Tax=Lasiosphaeria hispida TaxID=260671 RepID=A0AAJ0H7P8_9PEZI|nr:hypothetical protein B0T25DRAFT_359738 [Lasiosphaeria hispida]
MARVNFDNVDYNDPTSFAQLFGPNSGLPIPTLQRPDDVRKEARERSQVIHDAYNTLNEIVTRHEETIQKRWLKKSRQQRLKILLQFWPGMSAIHRPDFDAFRKESKQQRGQGTKYRDNFMWPYINQEDLSKPRNLLLLLSARARHHPSHFAAADITAIRLGIVTSAVVPIFLNEYVMVLNGATDASTYGELISWDDHPDAFDWMHTRKQFLPGEGLFALEIQERILNFLLACSRAILQDIAAEKLTSDTYPAQPEPHLKTEAEANGFESLAVMAAETPYRLPARIDFRRMELLLEAKASAAKDHVLALREDPDYFADRIVDIREHRQEMLKDTSGNIHPSIRPGKDAIFGARVIGNLVVEAYLELEIFAELHRQAKELRLLHDKYATQLSPTEDLPGDLLDRVLTFRHYLRQAAKGPLGSLRHNVVSSPPMRKFFVRQPPLNATTSQIAITSRPGNKSTTVEGHLYWLLSTLWEEGDTLFLADMSLVLDELERLLQASPLAADLVSSRIAEMISTASITGRCLSQINQFQPWARGFESAEALRLHSIKQRFAGWSTPLAYMMQVLKDQNLVRIAALADTANKRFLYPTEKRRTKENVEVLRRAERNLDAFWHAVDGILDVGCQQFRGTAVRTLLSEKRALQRTPEWVDVDVDGSATRPKQQRNAASSGGVESLSKPLSSLHFSGVSAGQAKVTTTAKTKTKTRGEPKEPSTQPLVAPEHVDTRAEPTPIPVDPRALKVFRTLFFNPGVTSSTGEVAWQDFVYAMTSTGLFSAEKLYGSAWQFQRLDTENQSRIQFHQPHPRGKIRFTMARTMGRRLTRAFGWVGAMFVARGNEDAA